MNRKVFLFIAATVMTAVSCLKEQMPQPQEEGVYFTFSAEREALNDPSSPASQQTGSKTILVEGNKVEWVKNDKVGVYNGINETGTDKVSAVDSDGATFKAELEAGQWKKSWEFAAQSAGSKSVFKAASTAFEASADEYLLLYPRSWNYYGNTEGANKMIRFWVARTQKATQGTFDPSHGFAVAKTNSLVTTSDNPIVFKNLMSLLKFTIPAELAGEITKITVWGKNNEHLGGEIICDYSGDEPVTLPFKKVYPESSKGYTDVSIEDTKGMAPGYYYLAVCPGDMSGLVVSITTKSGRNYRREKSKAFSFKSGVIYDMGEIEAETYNVKANGLSELPYAFSFDQKAKDTPTYLRKAVGSYDTTKKYCDLYLYDDAVGTAFQCRQIGESGQMRTGLNQVFWSQGRGAFNMPAMSMVSKEIAGDGYAESSFLMTLPVNFTMPKTFNVTFGMFMKSGSVKNWKLQYSADNTTWYDAVSFATRAADNDNYLIYSYDVTPQVTINQCLYLKWLPVGTETWGGGSAWGKEVRFWGGVIITDATEQQTTPAPAGAVYFEAFDNAKGGVDYWMGGRSDEITKLGGLVDATPALASSWNNLTLDKVTARPGYVQIGQQQSSYVLTWTSPGGTSRVGSLKTPKLAAGNLSLSFKAMMFRNPLYGRTDITVTDNTAPDKIIVNVVGGGTFEDGTTTTKIANVPHTTFQTYSLNIKDATADTQLQFTSPTDEGKHSNGTPMTRWFIDDICVMKDGADTDVARTIQVANPNLKIALPKESASNGKLVIMVPGGGYSGMNLVGDREGEGWASYYNERGIACATLRYTLPAGNCLLPVNDLKNAIKYIREHSTEFGVTEIGVHGFSAGGHLASTGATHFTGELRPDFQILFYPVITLRNATHNGSRNQFLGSNPSQYMLDLYSNELQVTENTPRAFVMYYVPDTVVPQATNGAAYVEALKAKNVPVKTLIYDTCYPDSDTQSGHGWWERDTRIDGKHVKEHLSDWLGTF